jgi:hypothetical protein
MVIPSNSQIRREGVLLRRMRKIAASFFAVVNFSPRLHARGVYDRPYWKEQVFEGHVQKSD